MQVYRCLLVGLLFPILAARMAWCADETETIEFTDVLVTAINDVKVPARSRGPIIRMVVSEGDRVAAGDLLALIDDGQPRLARERIAAQHQAAAEAAANDTKVRLAKKSLELTEADLRRAERARGLLADSISNEEFEARTLRVEQARLEVEQAEFDLKAAANEVKFLETDLKISERDLQLTHIVSPIDGVVVSRQANLGEWVEAGNEVFRVLRTNRLRAECFAAAAQLTESIVGKSVTVSVIFPDGEVHDFAGVMRFESPEMVAGDGRVKVWAEIENPDELLRPGMRGRMTVDLRSGKATRYSEPRSSKKQSQDE